MPAQRFGGDLERLSAPAALQSDHSLLSDRSDSGQLGLGQSDRFVGHVGDQPVGDAPRLFLGLAHNQVHAQPDLDLPTLGAGAGSDVLDLLSRLRDRLAPGQIDVGLRGGEFVRGIGRAAEPDGQRICTGGNKPTPPTVWWRPLKSTVSPARSRRKIVRNSEACA